MNPSPAGQSPESMSTLAPVAVRARPGLLGEMSHLAWPLVLTNGCWTMQIFLDRAFLAHHSGDEMAATLPAIMLYWSLLNLFFHTCGYVASFVSQYIGAGRPDRIGRAVGQALYVAVIGGVIFLGLIPFADDLVRLGGHSAKLQADETIFLRWLCVGALPELVKVSVFSFFNGRGSTRVVLGVSVVALSVNAILDYVLIFGRWGFPTLGIAGAGIATVAASTVAAAASFALMLAPRFRKESRTGEFWRFEPALFRRLLWFGVPNGLFFAIETTAFSVFVLIVGRFGGDALQASNMAFTLNVVAFLPTLGIGQAVEILVSRYLGEDSAERAERLTYVGLGLGFAIMITMAAVFVFLPRPALAPFVRTDNAAVVDLAVVLLRFVACYSLFDACNVVFACALRGAGDTRFVTRVMSGLPWVGMVLPAWLSLRYDWGVVWAWGFTSAYIAVLALVFFARFATGRWKVMRIVEPEVLGYRDRPEA